MTSSDFTFFGKQVPPPPTDKRFFDGEQTDPVTVFSGQTSQIYTSGGIEFQTPGGKTLSGSEYLSFTGQTGFDDNWKCSGTTGILKFAIDLAAPVEVCAHIRYCEEVGGTDEGTSAAVYLTGSGEGATQTQALAWRMNTEQSGWTWVQSGDFTLPAGPTTVQFNVAVADDNDFYIENFDLLTAPFTSTTLTISVYWRCIRSVTIVAQGKEEVTTEFTQGVDSAHSDSSTVATELGMSGSAALDAISLGINASIKKSETTSDSVTLKSSSSVKHVETYCNDGKEDYDLMLWQPVVVYQVGDGQIVEQHGDTIVATKCPDPDVGE